MVVVSLMDIIGLALLGVLAVVICVWFVVEAVRERRLRRELEAVRALAAENIRRMYREGTFKLDGQ